MIGTKILDERNSKYNGKIRVVRSFGLGTYIQAEGLTQSGGIVETIWRSTLKKINHYPLIIDNCLILGLGGGTVAKLVKKLWPDAKITGVDIDPVMIEFGKKHLGLDQVDVDIKVGDALEICEKLKPGYFDLIIVDLYSGDKYPEKFATEQFFHLAGGRLKKDGIIVFNRLYYGDKRPAAVKFGHKIEKIFSSVTWSYPEANLMFLCKI